MSEAAEELISELLSGAVELLDLPSDLEEAARAIYDDVGLWLSNDLEDGDWHFYPQGSLRLGTVVRPSEDDEYDIDAVAVCAVDKEATSQDKLKKTVGEALAGYVRAGRITDALSPTGCEESRRCWTLTFHKPLHMDVLPAIPDREAPPTGILLPDREMFRWQFSDPIAYSEWFFDRMSEDVIMKQREAAKRAQVDIDDIPTWRIRTPLQRIVQTLKLHRSHYFTDNPELRPPSILITTLAAKAYRAGSPRYRTLMDVATDMPRYIDIDEGTYWVPNPVQPQENFADIWGTQPANAAAFFDWLSDFKRTVEDATGIRSGLDAVVDKLASRFGDRAVRKSAHSLGQTRSADRTSGRLMVATSGLLGASGALRVKDHTFHGV